PIPRPRRWGRRARRDVGAYHCGNRVSTSGETRRELAATDKEPGMKPSIMAVCAVGLLPGPEAVAESTRETQVYFTYTLKCSTTVAGNVPGWVAVRNTTNRIIPLDAKIEIRLWYRKPRPHFETKFVPVRDQIRFSGSPEPIQPGGERLFFHIPGLDGCYALVK